MRVLIGCEYSGLVREQFSKLGHYAISCDLLPTEIEGNHYQGDIFDIIDDGFDLLIAFPPCTHLAVSGARWFQEKQEVQTLAIEFFRRLLLSNIPRIALENPVGIISSKIRKPDQYIQPWEFGHGETKKTGLWLKNLPHLKPTNIVPGRSNRIHMLPPSSDRSKLRSLTYSGIAEAMASQWSRPSNYQQSFIL
jgi:hypothetical protein